MPRRPPPLRLYYFAIFASLGAYLPYFPQWLEARGIDGFAMGAVSATFPAMGVVGPPAFGMLADALGLRGGILRVACLGAFLAFGVIAATGALGHPLAFGGLFTAALVYAFFRSPTVMMADVVTLEHARDAGASYGRIRLWGSIGFLAAALAAGRFLDPRAPVALPIAVALPLFAALVAAFRLPAKAGLPPLPAARHARDLLASRDYPLFLGVVFLAQIGHSAYDLCYSLRLRDLGASGSVVGVSWALGVVFEIPLMAVATPLFERFGAPRLTVVALTGAAARWALIAALPSVGAQLAIQPLHALSFAMMWLACVTYTKDRAPLALPTAQGLFTAALATGSVLGMLTWGPLYKRAGGAVVFGAAACVAACAAGLAIVWGRRLRSAADSAVPAEIGAP